MTKQDERSSDREDRQRRAIAKISSGVTGLDEILGGGFPEGRTTLVSGGPGTGKSLLGLEFLYRSASAGQAGILVAFEERADAIRRNAMALGWDLPALEKAGRLFVLEARIDRNAILAGTFSIKPLLAIIEGQAQIMKARRVVIDAVDVFLRVFRDPQQEREELHGLHDWLLENGFTTLVTTKVSESGDNSSSYGFLDYMTDCIVLLDQRVDGQVTTRRVRVVKYRGSGYAPNECPFLITDHGSLVMPISATSLEHRMSDERLSSGIERLDALSGGGYRRGTAVLIAGVTGTGKTSLACAFARQAAVRGESVLYVSFEESDHAVISNMLSPGIDLRPAVQAGHLEFLAVMPESAGVEQHLLGVYQRADAFKPDHIVVDAISACRRFGNERGAFDYIVRLIDACKQRGITLIMVNQLRHNDAPVDLTGLGIASLVDTIIVLRYTECRGGVIPVLRVYKNRGSKHSSGKHQFAITDNGIEVELSPGERLIGPETDSSVRRRSSE